MKRMRLLLLTALIIAVEVSAQHNTEFQFMQIVPEAVTQTMQLNAGKVFAEIHTSYEKKRNVVNIPQSCATAEGIKKIKMLWDARKFYCTETEVIARVLNASKGWQVGNIPCFFDPKQPMMKRITILYWNLHPMARSTTFTSRFLQFFIKKI